MKTRKKKVVYSGNQVDLPYMEFIQNNLFNMSHPVESIFETTNSSCNTPENLVNYFKTLFGVSAAGTWERFGEGKVVVGYQSSDNDFKTIGGTGGSKYLQAHTHTYTPEGTVSSHRHSYTPSGNISVAANPAFTGSYGETGNESNTHTHTYTPSGSIYSSNTEIRNDDTSHAGSAQIYSGTNTRSMDGSYNTSYFMDAAVITAHTHTFKGKEGTTSDQSSNHMHGYTPAGTISGGSYTFAGSASNTGTSIPTFSGSQGTTSSSGDGATQNLQPYIVVYRYRRIS